jgi:chromosome segregation ATPase
MNEDTLQQQIDEHETVEVETSSLEKALQQLWDKTRTAAEAIVALRTEKNNLEEKVKKLEISVAQAQSDILSKNIEVDQLRTLVDSLRVKESLDGTLSAKEKVELQEKIRLLIEKINAYL